MADSGQVAHNPSERMLSDEQLEETLRFIELVEREGESWDCIKLDNQEDEE